jgi:hypothetical protein
MFVHPLGTSDRPHVRLTRTIQAYLRYFLRIFKEYVQYVQLVKDVMDMSVRLLGPLRTSDCLRMPNMATLYNAI